MVVFLTRGRTAGPWHPGVLAWRRAEVVGSDPQAMKQVALGETVLVIPGCWHGQWFKSAFQGRASKIYSIDTYVHTLKKIDR